MSRGALMVVSLAIPLISALLVVPPSAAQTSWDAAQYGVWVDEGTRLYDEALSLPPEADFHRRALLLESARTKNLARAMLRASLASGAVDSFREGAIDEYFNLSENLIIHLSTLDQCEAAQLMIDQVGTDSDIIPTDASRFLDNLSQQVSDCRTRVARPNPSWGVEDWERLRSDAAGWRQQAREASGEASVVASLWFEAAQREQESLDLLRNSVLGVGNAPGVDDPAGELLAHYPRLIDDLIAIGACEVAQRRLLQWRFDRDLLAGDGSLDAEVSGRIEACRPSL